jgi:hypothetical protein
MTLQSEREAMQNLIGKINNGIYEKDDHYSYRHKSEGFPWYNYLMYDFNKLNYSIKFNTQDRETCKNFLKNMDHYIPYDSSKVNEVIRNVIKIYKEKEYCKDIKSIAIPASWSKFLPKNKRESYDMGFVFNKKVKHVDLNNKNKIKDFTIKMHLKLSDNNGLIKIEPIIMLQLPLKGLTLFNYYLTLEKDNVEIYEMNYTKKYTEDEFYAKVEKSIDNYFANQVIKLIDNKEVIKSDYMKSTNEEKEMYKIIAKMNAI